jgi:hypothetical protein
MLLMIPVTYDDGVFCIVGMDLRRRVDNKGRPETIDVLTLLSDMKPYGWTQLQLAGLPMNVHEPSTSPIDPMNLWG